jgi:hypothetical protein
VGFLSGLFGSSPKVKNIAAQIQPETDYEKAMREQLTGVATGLLGSASGLINQGTDLMSQTANGQVNGDVAANLQRLSLDNYNKQVGSIANNMAFRNLGSNSMTQNALAQAGTDANNWVMDNLQSVLNQQGQTAQSLYSMGQGNTSLASGLYDNWLGFRQSMSQPAQTAVTQGSSGLLGSALSGWASGGFKGLK